MVDDSRYLAPTSELAKAVTAAIHKGNTPTLEALVAEHRELGRIRIGNAAQSRTLLHIATDWPGHFPNVAATIRVLVDAGAEIDAPFEGPHVETALHWAASSDDVAALDALLDAGADIEAEGAVLGGGTALADACGFGQWNAARRLVERGAVTRLQDAAALGMLDRIGAHLAGEPDPETITMSLWFAASGSQREAVDVLLEHGADLNWVGWNHQTPLDVAIANEDVAFTAWLRGRGARTVDELARES